MVAEKTEYALSQGIKVCLCCGETLKERECNETMTVVCKQIQAVAGCDYIIEYNILTNHFYINTWLFVMEFFFSFQISDLQTMFLRLRCSKNWMLGKCGHCIRADLGHWHWQSCFSWASPGSKLLSCPRLADRSMDVQMLITMHSVHLIVLLNLTHDFSGHLNTHKIITMSIVPLVLITLSNSCTTQVHYNLRKWLDCNVSSQVAQNTRIIYGGILNASHPLLYLQTVLFLEDYETHTNHR